VSEVSYLYQKYGPMVLRRYRYLLQNEERALDALQDTFVKLLHYEKRLKLDTPSSLLYRIATNVCLIILRSERRHPKTEQEDLLLNIVNADHL
jgi:RNA polymerase sigma-70 factor (ECF subfamily)